MSDKSVVDKAQAEVDFIIRQLSGYKIPATGVTKNFLVNLLNNNGYSDVQMVILNSTKQPTVISASSWEK